MCLLKNLKVGSEIKFKHRFHREDSFSVISGKIIEICPNGVDCVVWSEFGNFHIGEWLIV